jgi:hypothetical protein
VKEEKKEKKIPVSLDEFAKRSLKNSNLEENLENMNLAKK